MNIDSFSRMDVVASTQKNKAVRIIFKTYDGEEHSIELTRMNAKWLGKALKNATKFSKT